MTIDEIQKQQGGWSKRYGSSATGGYQFMRATLGDLKKEMGLSSNERLTPDLQDRLAMQLLTRRGFDAFLSGRIDQTEFGKRLAMEWASFPVLADTRGAHRHIRRGQSYYAGDGLNKALVTPATIEAVIDRVKAAEVRPPAVKPVPVPIPGVDKPLPKSTTFWSAIAGFAATLVGSISALHPIVQGGAILVAAGCAVWIIRERRKKAAAQRQLVAQFREVS